MKDIWKRVICNTILLIFILNFLLIINVTADKGGISITNIDIPINEPGQKAIICWDDNVQKEMLILSTDISAGQETKVLEILPLPSEPEIYKCNITIFESVKRLTERVEYAESKDSGGSDGSDSKNIKPIEIDIIFRKTIGIHNLTVIKAYTASGFANYTAEFIRSVDLTPMSYPEAEKLAAVYISRDIKYFVLDIIDLNQDVISPEPLVYIFDSKSVYYPMEITSLTGGNSHILLFIITPYYKTKDLYETKEETDLKVITTTWLEEKFIDIKPPVSPVEFDMITSTDVHTGNFYDDGVDTYDGRFNDPDFHYIKDFFSNYNRVKISVFEYEGPVEMKGDILIGEYSIRQIIVDEESQIKMSYVSYPLYLVPLILISAILIVLYYIHYKSNK